ncbi:MAG: glycoside hydrolase family 38 C-terminal domain-containing protein, partial [Streptosporangiaceae bacterium]
PAASGWRHAAGTGAENERYLVTVDPARGGALSRLHDKRSGKELLSPGEVGGELVLHDEYPDHPEFREGPWHLVPTGTRVGSSSARAAVHAETSPAGSKIVSSFRLGELVCTQEVVLWHGLERVDFRTRVDGSIGRDRLLRVRFPFAVEGARPVYEVAGAVIGRTFGFPDVDAAQHPWTQDNPAHTWVGLSSTARVALREAGGRETRHAVGVAEIVAPDDVPGVRDLVAALAGQGVTATTTRPDGPRYGSLDVDSNLPDVRVSIGGPERNAFTARVLDSVDEAYAARLADTGHGRVWVPQARARRETWVPGADLRGERDLPVLIVAGQDWQDADTAATPLARLVAELVDDLADATIDVEQPESLGGTSEPLEDYSIAVLNRGIPGAVVEADGTTHLSLVRASSGWPARTWIDGPRRGAPDRSSFAWQHWSHTFEYALAAGAGDWREAGFVHRGHAYNHAIEARPVDVHDGSLPPTGSLLAVEPSDVILTALKPRGNPLAAGRPVDDDGAVALRCHETRGRVTRARVRCFVPFRDGALTTILEESPAGLRTEDGMLVVDLGPTRAATATAVPTMPMRGGGPMLGAAREPVQPVYARYWLHNKGPAPLGGQPLSVSVEPRALDLTESTESAPLRVTVSAAGQARGRLDVIVPHGVAAELPSDLDYDITNGAYARFDVLVRPREGVAPGAYHLAARVMDGLGQVLEDVAVLRVGLRTSRPPDLDVQVDTPGVRLATGERAGLRVRLVNPCPDAVRGEAQLISPFGSWELLRPWTQGFAVEGGRETTVAYDIRVPPGTRPMATWVLVKVMAAGRVLYSPSVPVVVEERDTPAAASRP